MASTIILSDNGVSSGSAGLKSTAGNDGVLILQTTTSGGTATNALYIDTNQNVGLGATPNASWAGGKALVLNSGYVQAFSATEFDIGSNVYFNGTSHYYLTTGAAALYRQNSGAHKWYRAPSGTAGTVAAFTQGLTFDTNSSLQIGTTVGVSANSLFVAGNIGNGGTSTLSIYQNSMLNAAASADIYISNGVASRYYQDTGTHVWQTAPSGTAGATITYTTIMSVTKDASLALQGATPVSGTGVTFPATQSASSNANTLDDYEEGTWTPTAATAGYTISAANGFYTKTGRVVTLLWNVTFSAVPASNSAVQLNGCPFVSGVSLGIGTCTSGVCRENSSTGAIYVTNIQNNGLGTVEINSMDGVSAGSQRTIQTSQVYSCSLTFFTS